MNKILALILALTLTIALCACGAKEETADQNTSEVKLEGSLTDIMAQIYEKAPETEMAMGEPMPIDIADADAVKYYLGLDSADGIKEAVFSEPMIGSIAYSVCLVRCEEGADVETVKKNISDNVDARKWICVTAEKVIVNNCGDVVILVMTEAKTAEGIYNAFAEIAGEGLGTVIERAGE